MSVKVYFYLVMRLLILFAICLISGCDLLDVGSNKYTANIEFKTTRINDGAETHEVTISLFDSGVKQDLESVKLNGTAINNNGQNTHLSTSTIEPIEYKVVVDVGNDFYDQQQIFESAINIEPDPTFFIKLADDLRDVKTSVTQNYTASMGSSYVGFDINGSNSQYQVTGVAYVKGANGEKSKEYNIDNEAVLSKKLLSGEFTSFKPVQLVLALTFSYNGSLSGSFKDGYIRRVYEIKQEIDISN